ncbi:MAG: hypothetical protein HWQ38_07980 [Nostoc sp. NMS7]|uniref:hypothetical protein n=1 Tax=Nostoc sp. NMS7 TaxID=2815391 RepID=UPI0025E0D514|nr:hypothetical protein [Nostoc sp. NMS7]MBN3946420.1 hypothetical protein [Nostoc sp. NMS7]
MVKKTERELAELLVNIIRSQQPTFTVQGSKLTGKNSNGDTFELQMFPSNVINQSTAISR